MNFADIILATTLALWGTGWLLLGRMKQCRGDAEQFVPADEVSIIIPARNEEQNLPVLVRSLASQSVRPQEIIVVNDASTDRTAEVARQLRARVVDSQPLPEGWRGKTWACHQGAQAATGEWLMFLDADTWFEPEGLARVLADFAGGLVAATPRRLDVTATPSSPDASPSHHRLRQCAEGGASTVGDGASPPLMGAFSIGPFHAVKKPYESLSLFFNFNMTVGTVPDGLFGQMLLVDRESYQRVGGHEAVKGRTLENFFLAQQFRAAGIGTRSATGRGVLAFRMYPNGPRELIEGWTKGFAAGAGQTPPRVLWLVVAWMIGLMLAPICWLVTGQHMMWGGVYLLCAAQVAWFSRQVGSFGLASAALYPVPLIFFFAIFTRSAMRSGKRVTWKGREMRAD